MATQGPRRPAPLEGGPAPATVEAPGAAEDVCDFVAQLEHAVRTHHQLEGQGDAVAGMDGATRTVEVAPVLERVRRLVSAEAVRVRGGMRQPGRFEWGSWWSTAVTWTMVGGTPTRQTSPPSAARRAGPFGRSDDPVPVRAVVVAVDLPPRPSHRADWWPTRSSRFNRGRFRGLVVCLSHSPRRAIALMRVRARGRLHLKVPGELLALEGMEVGGQGRGCERGPGRRLRSR